MTRNKISGSLVLPLTAAALVLSFATDLGAAPAPVRSMSSLMHLDHASDPWAMPVADDSRILENFHFALSPSALEGGTTASWENLDLGPRSDVGIDGLLRSRRLDPNHLFTFKFDVPTYNFLSFVDPQTVGTTAVR